MRKLVVSTLSIVLLVTLASCAGDDTTPALPSAEVELVRDGLGLVHVHAKTERDALFGEGYAMARDRLFQMELTRRQALGRSAELFGERSRKGDIGARTFGFARLGEQDLERARREKPEDAAALEAWTAGVNARIAEVRDGRAPRPYGLREGELDFVPEPWLPRDAAAIGKLLAFGLSSSLDAEILATALLNLAPGLMSRVPIFQPAFDDVHPMVAPAAAAPRAKPPNLPRGARRATVPLPEGLLRGPRAWPERPMGSNNWGVTAAKSTNGRPILAGDPHQPLTSPTRLYPIELHADSGLSVFGFSFVGAPGVQLGHTATVGWTATTSFADVMDMWDVTTTADASEITLGDGAHAVRHRKESLLVRGEGPVGTGEREELDVAEVPGYGVLLPESILPLPRSFLVEGNAILFQWTGFRPTLELSAYLGMDRAKTVGDFEAAADLLSVGAQNFLAADREHLLYHVRAAVPDRGAPGSHAMPWRILPGSDRESLWTRGDLGKERFPHVMDPAVGFFGTANSDPWGHTRDGDVENDPFYFGTVFANGFRYRRIVDRLTADIARKGTLDRSDVEDLQRDVHSVLADTFVPRIQAALRAAKTEPALAPYRARPDLDALGAALAAWDRRMDHARGEPLLFTATYWFAARAVFEPLATKALFEAVAEKSPPFWPGLLRNVTEGRFEGSEALLSGGTDLVFLKALEEARAWLAAQFGSADPSAYRWESHMRARFPNAFGGRLAVDPAAVDGALDTLSVANAPFFDGAAPAKLSAPVDAPLYRMVMTFDDDGKVVSGFDLARGASEDPDSPWFANLQSSWERAEHLRALRLEEAKASRMERHVLPPGAGRP